MKIKNIYTLLPLLTILCGCQSEISTENSTPTQELMAKATFPTYDKTRTQITYGNPNKEKEIFNWSEGDEIFLYNMTLFKDYPDPACFDIQPGFDISANFKFDLGSGGYAKEFHVNKGDTILVIYGETERVKQASLLPDERNVVNIKVGTEGNYPQYIVEDPDNTSYMSYMKGNLKMYDIVVAENNDIIPDIQFRHLSAILRVSLRNETDHDLFPTKLDFEYPGTESFFSTAIYCSLDPDPENKSGLKIYNGDFHGGSDVYTSIIGTSVNGKDGTYDKGGIITQGRTYDLYISTVPKIEKQIPGEDGLTIKLVEQHDTGDESIYSITIPNFNVAIEAGKRYWFNLTAVEENGERKLMLTNEWLEQHEDAEKVYE